MDSRSDNPGNGHSDRRSDSSDDGQWMTYAELAEARGIKLRAAVRQVQRQALRRQPGNDGKTRVWVPCDILETSPRPEQPSQRPAPRPGHSDVAEMARVFVATLQGKQDEIDTLRQDIATLRTRAEVADTAVEVAETRAQEALQAATRAEQAHATAQEALRGLEQQEAARKARGRWARLRLAWRGE